MENKNRILTDACCSCGNCVNVCPKNAISWTEEVLGNQKAAVDADACVGCGLCEKICPILSPTALNAPLCAYAAVSKSEEAERSASGGAFYELAKEILRRNGVVFGAAYGDNMTVKHIPVTDVEELKKLQGSKYVRSSLGSVSKTVISCLQEDRWVLFSGTPCQVAAMRKCIPAWVNTQKLVLVDLICHGTPSGKLFREYLDTIHHGRPLEEFTFRDKKYGSKLIGKIVAGGKARPLYSGESSYYKLFLSGAIYGRNCYSCAFAQRNRVGDITLGDFWGIKGEYPEFFSSHGLPISNAVSAVMVNTPKGAEMLNGIREQMNLQQVDYEKIIRNNPQLRMPVILPGERTEIEAVYQESGYPGIEKWFCRKMGLKRYSMRVHSMVPKPIKEWILACRRRK